MMVQQIPNSLADNAAEEDREVTAERGNVPCVQVMALQCPVASSVHASIRELHQLFDRPHVSLELKGKSIKLLSQVVAERTHHKGLIRKLQAHIQHLQWEKSALLGQLAAAVAHEINNPLGFANSNIGTLQRYMEKLQQLLVAYEQLEGSLPETAQQNLSRLKSEIDADFIREDIGTLLIESLDGLGRVKRIVYSLNGFSPVAPWKREWASLEIGLDNTLDVLSHKLKVTDKVFKEYGGIPAIQCFPLQLNQVFTNLLINAANEIKEQGRITIRTGQEGETVWVEVADTGPGIQPEHLARIFDPLFTDQSVGKGFGLGLSLSYEIVSRHGGRIEWRSEPGKGSVFRVVLPRTADLRHGA